MQKLTEETGNLGKYYRINNRMMELLKRQEINPQVENMMEYDCILHLFECEGFKIYEEISSFCRERGISRVIDIGCANGHQSEVFLNEGLQYVGVNDHNATFWNQDLFQYIVNRYPCELPTQNGDLGVSVWCLTWNCYLYEGEKTLKEQCEALQRDFEHCLLNIPSDKLEFVHRYFPKVEKVGKRLYYFKK